MTEVTRVDISIADHSIRVEHHGDVASMVEKELTDASFEVQRLKMSDSNGIIVHEYNPQPCPRRTWASPFFMSEAQKRHLNNCNACKAQTANKKRTSAGKISRYIHRRRMDVTNAQSTSAACDNLENQQEKPAIINVDRPSHDDSLDPQDTIFKATISIGGMTCAACVGTVTKELEVLDNVRSVSVSLLANNATVKFQGPKNNVDNIVEAIEDVGFEATLDEVIAEPTTSQQHDLARTNSKPL